MALEPKYVIAAFTPLSGILLEDIQGPSAFIEKLCNEDYTFFYKQSIFDTCPENCLIFSKKSP